MHLPSPRVIMVASITIILLFLGLFAWRFPNARAKESKLVTATPILEFTGTSHNGVVIVLPVGGFARPDHAKPCQVLYAAPRREKVENAGLLTLSPLYEWYDLSAVPEIIPDGLYIASVQIRNGKILPCE